MYSKCLLSKDVAVYILNSNFKLVCGSSFLLFAISFLSIMTFQKRVFVFVDIFGPVWWERSTAKTETCFRFCFSSDRLDRPKAGYYRTVFRSRFFRLPTFLGYCSNKKSEKTDFIENLESDLPFPTWWKKVGSRHIQCDVPIRKNKKAAVRRNIRILVSSSDQDRGPDFPNQRISYSTREEFWVSEVGKKPDFPTFRLCYSNRPKAIPCGATEFFFANIELPPKNQKKPKKWKKRNIGTNRVFAKAVLRLSNYGNFFWPKVSRKICGNLIWNFDNFSKVSGFQNQIPILTGDFFRFSFFWTEKWKNVSSVFANHISKKNSTIFSFSFLVIWKS